MMMSSVIPLEFCAQKVNILSDAEDLGGQGVLEPPHFSIRGGELPQNWRLSLKY